jgi:alpha-D-ribose 1-methylphosphonate 5-triphosphate diphosphatase
MPRKGNATMTKEQIFANANIVLPDQVIHGAVTVRDGVITAIDSGTSVPTGAEDFEGDLLCPGLVELHTDNLERHIQPRPKVDWPHAAALVAHDAELASTGITTVFDAMRVGSIPTGKSRYGAYARSLATELLDMRSAGALKISHYLHLRAEVCSETLEEEMAAFGPEDRVGIVSLMDHTPGQRQFRDISKLKTYVMGKNNLNEEEFADHVANLQDMRARNGDRHEVVAVAEAKRYGAVLASHDDTTRGHVETSAHHGIHLAEFPTTVEAAQACRDHGIAVMMGAPNLIRGGSHSGNVAAGELAELDLLDIVSSDYVPAALLAAGLLLGDMWGNTARGIKTITQTPARASGLMDRGDIAIGQRADMIRVKRIANAPVLRGTWVQGNRVA